MSSHQKTDRNKKKEKQTQLIPAKQKNDEQILPIKVKKVLQKSKNGMQTQFVPNDTCDGGMLAIMKPKKTVRRSQDSKQKIPLPDKLGKAIRLHVPDFSNTNRKLTCLEADFPIAQINELARLEASSGAAKKPIYSMSKWWARRQSSVFRSILIAAATESPDDPNEAAKLVWDHYYCNHQKAGSFKDLRVLDCFMGGGTTLVEGSRLGMQMTGVDLNPIAWFIVKNELACSDPEQVKKFFAYIEHEVKPQIQPFYTTKCPRGHVGRWIDIKSGELVTTSPIEMPPEQRSKYRWEGPEVLYTFWAKHGPCQAKDCKHRTPIFKTPIVSEKKLITYFIETTCPSCGLSFNIELGETRLSPSSQRVVLDKEPAFTELSQPFAALLKQYSQGTLDEKRKRLTTLLDTITEEEGLKCPHCKVFAGNAIKSILDRHATDRSRKSPIKKSDLLIKNRPIYMYLLVNPKWLVGDSGFDDKGELGGYAGASPESTRRWYERRLSGLNLIEVRGRINFTDDDKESAPLDQDDEPLEPEESSGTEEGEVEENDRKKFGLPNKITLSDGTFIQTKNGTMPVKSHFTCGLCGLGGRDKYSEKNNNILDAIRQIGHSAPHMVYALQCHCPQCQAEGYNYGGRYFKAPDLEDIQLLNRVEIEWDNRSKSDLSDFWPRVSTNPYPSGAPDNDSRVQNMDRWNYNYWWKMFNSRQLLVHSVLLKTITQAPDDAWPLDVREQGLGAFQQYLRANSLFSFYHIRNDQLAAALSNPNFHPKNLILETCVFNQIGSGRWGAYVNGVLEALEWARAPFEPLVGKGTASTPMEDHIVTGNRLFCGSSTDLSIIGNELFDLVITDPPFGNNIFYSDLADFFYVWLRIPLRKWYSGLPEERYFVSERTPHSMEAVDNKAEHPDDRQDFEKSHIIDVKNLARIKELTGDNTLAEKKPNPLFRPPPASDFYTQTLTACYSEAGRLLKTGGILAFTFHHSLDDAWIDVLKALFDAGFYLVATYPIRSDESKGEGAEFGAKTMQYDMIHVCRKRFGSPETVSWARMRHWVKDESLRLKQLLEYTHGKTLPEPDLRVILRGKSLEFYSRHYGQVFTGDGQVLDVREALLGINQILDDLMEETNQIDGIRPPGDANPATRLYMRLFQNRTEMDRDELHKTLRGTGIAPSDFEAKGWIRIVGRIVHLVPILERFDFFTEPGRNRKNIKADLDQTHFLIGMAFPNSGFNFDTELNNPHFHVIDSIDEILKWYSDVGKNSDIGNAAKLALQLVQRWRTRAVRPQPIQKNLDKQLRRTEDANNRE